MMESVYFSSLEVNELFLHHGYLFKKVRDTTAIAYGNTLHEEIDPYHLVAKIDLNEFMEFAKKQ